MGTVDSKELHKKEVETRTNKYVWDKPLVIGNRLIIDIRKLNAQNAKEVST